MPAGSQQAAELSLIYCSELPDASSSMLMSAFGFRICLKQHANSMTLA